MEVLMSLVSAVMVAFGIYASKAAQPGGEPFSFEKAFRTLVVGLGLGIVAQVTHYQITAENWGAYLFANAGLVGALDQLVKLIWRLVVRLRG